MRASCSNWSYENHAKEAARVTKNNAETKSVPRWKPLHAKMLPQIQIDDRRKKKLGLILDNVYEKYQRSL